MTPAEYWTAAREAFQGSARGADLNMAQAVVDRRAEGAEGERVALRFLGREGGETVIRYRELRDLSDRFAGALDRIGMERGATVATLLGPCPALHVTALGTLKHRSVFCPLFAGFGPEPARLRLALGHAKLLVTTPRLYAGRIAGLRDALPELRHVVLVGAEATASEALAFDRFLGETGGRYVIPPTDPETPALLHFTSGTTGRPKGAVHVHEAVVGHHASARAALGLRRGDVFWCTADPGWVTGTSYGVLAPLAIGATSLVYTGDFDPARWCALLAREAVDVWYTTPTALRMIRRLGGASAHRYPQLRVAACVGEALDADTVRWAEAAFGVPMRDTWWQTETGSIMVANMAEAEVRPGAMGQPLPGLESRVVRHGEAGACEPLPPGEIGELALRAGWPSMFRTYLDDEARYRRCFRDGWYLSGDLVRCDRDGYYWFVSRADDVIKSSGHLIGAAEVEGALLAHPAVADAAAIGKPDAAAGEIVKCFVVLGPGAEPTPAVARELRAHARTRLGAAVAPREIAFLEAIPRTRSGKKMRRLLRARELGLPSGDLSTLAPDDGGAVDVSPAPSDAESVKEETTDD